MPSIYDNPAFFSAYAEMPRSQGGLAAAGEWHQLGPLFPDVAGKAVLDLGCGYGWHCGYAAARGAAEGRFLAARRAFFPPKMPLLPQKSGI